MSQDTSKETPKTAPTIIHQEAPLHKEGEELLQCIKRHLGELQVLEQKSNSHWEGEDGFYRFYHGSMKVYYLQKKTTKIVEKFKEIGKESGLERLNAVFENIISEGTDITFDLSHNKEWEKHTRPILEAFFHAREMLHFMVLYGKKLDHAPNYLPSGWAAVLYLYNIR